jgi:hypothetical protein
LGPAQLLMAHECRYSWPVFPCITAHDEPANLAHLGVRVGAILVPAPQCDAASEEEPQCLQDPAVIGSMWLCQHLGTDSAQPAGSYFSKKSFRRSASSSLVAAASEFLSWSRRVSAEPSVEELQGWRTRHVLRHAHTFRDLACYLCGLLEMYRCRSQSLQVGVLPCRRLRHL